MPQLPHVIAVDDSKCVNCHACISACPVKYCNDGSGATIRLDHELRVGCGQCLKACTHGARLPLDDFEAFLEGVRARVPMVACAWVLLCLGCAWTGRLSRTPPTVSDGRRLADFCCRFVAS